MPSDRTPSRSAFPYAGWVPTANGRLSFRHIGETRHPTPSIYANVATLARRYVLGFQRRNLSDSAFRSVTDYICSVSGDFWFAVAATSTAAPDNLDAAITGVVYIFKTKDDWRNGPADIVRGAIEDLNTNRFSLDEDRDQQTDKKYHTARKALAEYADISIKFELQRGGEVYASEPSFKDQELAYASKSLAKDSGHDFDKWIADQSYFFLRDIAHQHQHHAPHVDTILTLQKHDDAWRRSILFSLHYYIISARRTRHPPMLIQALGVLAYCRSFTGVCRSAEHDPSQLPNFEIDAIEASLRARIDEESYLIAAFERRGMKVWNSRLTLIAVLAPVLALIGVFVQPRIGTEEGVKRFPGLNHASDVLSDHFTDMLGLIVLIFVVAWSLTSLVPALRAASTGRDVLRIGLVRHQIAAAVSAIVGVGALAAGAYFGWEALKEVSEPVILLFQGALGLIFQKM